jgi:hypothetical protein
VVIAEYKSMVVYMVKEIIATGFSNDLIGGVSGNLFCASIPVRDDAVAIQVVYAILQAVQDFLVEVIIHGFSYYHGNS